jgi:hypothetical protein
MEKMGERSSQTITEIINIKYVEARRTEKTDFGTHT